MTMNRQGAQKHSKATESDMGKPMKSRNTWVLTWRSTSSKSLEKLEAASCIQLACRYIIQTPGLLSRVEAANLGVLAEGYRARECMEWLRG